jgi:methionine sulfoxide reductase catalytic subunit
MLHSKVTILKRRGWEIPESQVTSESVFFNRRAVLSGLASLPLIGSAQAAVNAKFADAGRAVTPEEQNTTYNNFYEYGTSKNISEAAQALVTKPWSITIDGLVDAPMTVDFEDLMKKMAVEDRVYRHRCVEAWAMVVPWTGFALKDLVALAKPKAEAKYVRFETFNDPKMAPGQEPGLFAAYPWPYVEGLTMAEAMNDLAFIATGAYGRDLPKAMGAPLRLHTPWKYGFKSIKSIVKISFVAEQPMNFWQAIQSSEYGFWANVNPEVSHPRWSQATEEVLGTGERVPTKLFNGYGEFVADVYKGMEKDPIFF